jgi:hypothetical protein
MRKPRFITKITESATVKAAKGLASAVAKDTKLDRMAKVIQVEDGRVSVPLPKLPKKKVQDDNPWTRRS